MNPERMSCHDNLENWGGELRAKADTMRKTLTAADQTDNLQILESIMSTFGYEGALNDFEQWIPK